MLECGPSLRTSQNTAVQSITIPFRSYNRFVGIIDGGVREGVQYYFVDCPELFDRQELYGAREPATILTTQSASAFTAAPCLKLANFLASPTCFTFMTGRLT